MRDVRVCIVKYDVYSTLPLSKCLAFLMRICSYIHAHDFKLDRTEQNEQHLIDQSIMTSIN
jgi:hypothetical protein